MTLYRVWYDSDRDEDDADDFTAASPDDAADEWCDKEQWDEGPPDRFVLHVRDTESGKLYTCATECGELVQLYVMRLGLVDPRALSLLQGERRRESWSLKRSLARSLLRFSAPDAATSSHLAR